jgi:hypothetical protein
VIRKATPKTMHSQKPMQRPRYVKHATSDGDAGVAQGAPKTI